MIFVAEDGYKLLRYDIKRDLVRDNESRSRYRNPEGFGVLSSMWMKDEADEDMVMEMGRRKAKMALRELVRDGGGGSVLAFSGRGGVKRIVGNELKP